MKMKKYEYLAKHFADFREAYPTLKRDDLSKWLSTFGADGWELTYIMVSEGIAKEWYFRRELPQPLMTAPMDPHLPL